MSLNFVCCLIAIALGTLLLWLAHWCQTHIFVPLEKPPPPGDIYRDGDYEGPVRKGDVPEQHGPTLLEKLQGTTPEPVDDPWKHPAGVVANSARVAVGTVAAYIGLLLLIAALLGGLMG